MTLPAMMSRWGRIMITPELWKKNVSDSVRSIADRNFQELAWYGKLEGIASSPSDVYCMLFDDDDIEDFIERDRKSVV